MPFFDYSKMSFLWTKKCPYDNVGPQWVHVFAAKKGHRLSTFLRLCEEYKYSFVQHQG